jgi:putative endonuclease
LDEKLWQVYMIRSDDDQLYTGITTDIQRRWREHTCGKAGARFFRGRKPQELCLLEFCTDRSSASKREASIKRLTRTAKNALLSQQSAAQRIHLLALQSTLSDSL